MTPIVLAAALLVAVADAPRPVAPDGAPTGAASRTGASPVRARFEAARAALLAGDLGRAATAFEAVALDPEAGASLAEAARVLAEASRELGRRGDFVLRPPLAPGPGQVPRLDRSGRGDLAWFTTFYGIATANGLGALWEIEDGKTYLALTIAGAGAGLIGALVGTRAVSMSEGRAATIEGATTWSTANAAALCAIADRDGRSTLGATLGAGAVGLVVSAALTSSRAPSAGDMSIVNSAGAWGLVAGALSLTFAGDDVSPQRAGWTLLAGTDLGLLVGGLTASRVEVSRGRMLVIDAGGILGALVGVAIPVFAEAHDPQAYGLAALAGITVGLGTARHLTASWDDEAPRPLAASSPRAGPRAGPALLPLAGGGTAAGIAGAF